MSGISVWAPARRNPDDEIGPVLDDLTDEVRELLGRVGCVSVEEPDQLVRRGCEAGLERGAVATVDLMPDETHLWERGDGFRQSVLGAVVDGDDLELVDADPLGNRP